MSTELKGISVIVFLYIVLTLMFTATVEAKTIILKTTNTINVDGAINSQSMKDVKKRVLELVYKRGKKDYPLYLVIDSPGGSIYAGNKLINLLDTVDNLHTITIFAASMGSGIVQSVKGKRYITKNGIMMFHRAKGQFAGQFNDGEVEKQLELWKKIVTQMEQTNADRLKIPLIEYKKRVKDEYWLTAKDSIKDNAADKVVKIKCTKQLAALEKSISIRTIFGIFERKVNRCPHLR